MLLTDLSTDQLMMLIAPALPNMWALRHAMYHDFPTPKEKSRWMMACIFLPCIGGLAYYFVGKKRASKEKIDIFARKDAPSAEPAAEAFSHQEQPAADQKNEVLEECEKTAAPCAMHDQTAVSALEKAEEKEVSAEKDVCAQAEEGRQKTSAGSDAWSFGCPDDVRRN